MEKKKERAKREWRRDLAPARTRVREHKWLPDPFDPEQDLLDDVAVAEPFTVPADGHDCLLMLTCGVGDGGRLLLYCAERYADAKPVLEGEGVVGLRFVSEESRARVARLMFADTMLEKKCDRFYLVDRVSEWGVDWAMRVVKESGLWEWSGEPRFRVVAAPRKLEQEMVVTVEDTCEWMGRPKVAFAPQGFSHGVFVVKFEAECRTLLGWGVAAAELVYLKSPVKAEGKESKISRAYFKLFEALQRFDIQLPQGGKAVDVGASPGGWTQCLVERGLKVWSVDPAPLSIDMTNVVWLDGLSSSPAVEARLREDGPFDIIVSDMNQLPDELARSFDNLVELLVPGGVMIITIKLSHLRPEQRAARKFSKGSNRLIKYFAQTHPSLQLVGLKWLLQNKNERCIVFRKLE